jgi:hypothetical protein
MNKRILRLTFAVVLLAAASLGASTKSAKDGSWFQKASGTLLHAESGICTIYCAGKPGVSVPADSAEDCGAQCAAMCGGPCTQINT